MELKLYKDFFSEKADIVAEGLLGTVLVMWNGARQLRAKIVETEAYFGIEDPASRAGKGKNKISEMMWASPGTIMIYNVHKYKMFNIVTWKKGEPNAVLIRALEPLNFKARLSGPGLLTEFLKIDKRYYGQDITTLQELYIIKGENNPFTVTRSFRIGVTRDLKLKMRFYIAGNRFVSR